MKGAVRIAVVAGVEVAIHWSLFVLAGVLMLVPWPVEAQEIGWRAGFVAVLFGSVLLHELGHVAAGRFCDGAAHGIVLWPLGGLALVHLPDAPMAHFLTALAGPLVSLGLWLGGEWLAGITGAWVWRDVARVNGALWLFNLLPAYPMDGGRMLHAVLWRRLGQTRALWVCVHVALGLAAGMAVWAFVHHGVFGVLGAAWAVYVFFAAWQERELLAREAGAGEYWQGRPGVAHNHPYQRWRQRRQARRTERDERFIEEEIDPILDKISREGMQSLSRRERKVLESARDLMQKRRR